MGDGGGFCSWDVEVVSVVGEIFDETWVWEKDVPVAVEGMLQ